MTKPFKYNVRKYTKDILQVLFNEKLWKHSFWSLGLIKEPAVIKNAV